MFKTIKGSSPIIFSAPHNVVTIRKGRRKPKDANTGAVTSTLCKKYSAWGIIATKAQKDPNWYTGSPFRAKLKKLVKSNIIGVVFDIHGRKKGHKNLLELYPNQTFNKKYSNLLDGLTIKKFKDDDQLTIIEDFENLDVAGVQIEIRRDGRNLNTAKFNEVMNALDKLVSEIIKSLRLANFEAK